MALKRFINRLNKGYIFLGLIIILLIVSISMYFYKFNNGFSSISDDWGNFGSYIGGISSLLLSSVAIYASWIFSQKNYNNEMVDKYMMRVIDRMSEIEKMLPFINSTLKNQNRTDLVALATKYSEEDSREKMQLAQCISKCNYSFSAINTMLTLCFSRYELHYDREKELLSSLNDGCKSAESVEKLYNDVNAFLGIYKSGVS